MINVRLVALTWITQPIIAVLIARMRIIERIALGLSTPTRIIERIVLGLSTPARTIERIILGLVALTWTVQPITALLSARMRSIGPIILGRGPRLLSTPHRSIQCRRIRPHLRTRLPNMQPRNMKHMKVLAQSHLAMSAMRSRLIDISGLKVWPAAYGENPISCHRQ